MPFDGVHYGDPFDAPAIASQPAAPLVSDDLVAALAQVLAKQGKLGEATALYRAQIAPLRGRPRQRLTTGHNARCKSSCWRWPARPAHTSR